MAITVKEIAKRANVSGSTVSRVLNQRGQDFISEATRERVLQVASEMGYRPNLGWAARALRSGKSQMIGVLIDSRGSAFVQQILPEIEQQAMGMGYRVLAGHAHDSVEQFKKHIDGFVAYGVDGILCLSHDYQGMAHWLPEILSDFPETVFLGRPEGAGPHALAYVQPDMVHAYRNAVAYLAACGKKRIALLLNNLDYQTTRDRHAGYREGLAVMGRPPEAERVILGQSLNDDARNMLEDLRRWEADGVLVENDWLAMRLIRACHQAGVAVPHQLAIVGCDNHDFGPCLMPALTTIGWDVPDLARQLLEMLMGKIQKDPGEAERCVVMSDLVIRESA